MTSSHMEALEEIFKRVQFREVDFQDCFLDDNSAGILFDILKHYESCQDLKITATFDQPHQRSSWNKCIQYLRKSKEITSFSLFRSHLNQDYFVGVNFIGFRVDNFSLIECNIGNDVRLMAFFSKAIKNNFMLGSFGSNKVLFEQLKTLLNLKTPSKVSSQSMLMQKFSERYSSKLWRFTLNLKGNKLTSSIIENINTLLTHNLFLVDIKSVIDSELGERGFQIFRGNGFLFELNLSSNYLKDQGVQQLVSELSLNLNRNINRILINLIRIYKSNEYKTNEEVLEKIVGMSRKEILAMSRIKRIYCLERLNLSNNSITSSAMVKIGEWLSEKMICANDLPNPMHNFVSLQMLDLSNNPLIGDKGVEILCLYLTTNKTLKTLILRNCNFTFIGVYAVASYLSETTTLELLDIRENELKLNSLMALAKTLQFNNSLKIFLLDSLKVLTSQINPQTEENEILLMTKFYAEINDFVHRNNSESNGCISSMHPDIDPDEEEVTEIITHDDDVMVIENPHTAEEDCL